MGNVNHSGQALNRRVTAGPAGNAAADVMARLVDEAARLLVEHGPAGLSLRKVAAAAGVSTMPVYTLFGDKRGLLAAMHREGFRRLAQALHEVPQTEDPLADLARLGQAYRRAALASSNLYALMFGHVVPEFSPGSGGRAVAQTAYSPLVDAVARCQQADLLTGDDPERVALHLWAVAHGMVSLEINQQLPQIAPADELYTQALTYAGVPFLPARPASEDS